MLTWFTEDSLMPLITGSLMALAFLGLGITHYNRQMFLIALAIGSITAAIVGIETWIVTDKEAIESQVRRLATALEQKDVQEIVNAISDKRKDVRDRAQQEMQNFTINSCRIVDFTDFQLNDTSLPHQAETTFVVIAQGNDRSGNRGTAHERVTLYFEKDQVGKWKIINYKHEYARAGGRL